MFGKTLWQFFRYLWRIQCWCRYSRPRRVWSVYDLIFAGVRTRLWSLIITWPKLKFPCWLFYSHLQIGVHEVHDNGDTWDVAKDIHQLNNVFMFHLQSKNVQSKILIKLEKNLERTPLFWRTFLICTSCKSLISLRAVRLIPSFASALKLKIKQALTAINNHVVHEVQMKVFRYHDKTFPQNLLPSLIFFTATILPSLLCLSKAL